MNADRALQLKASVRLLVRGTDNESRSHAALAGILSFFLRQEPWEYRVSRDAWQFFLYGFGSNSLHDARLLSLQAGDRLSYIADGKRGNVAASASFYCGLGRLITMEK